nr:hypothetical protein [Nostoc sp. DedQUE02]
MNLDFARLPRSRNSVQVARLPPSDALSVAEVSKLSASLGTRYWEKVILIPNL